MGDDSRWPFADPPNVAVITVTQVLRQGMPVVYVSHDEDDGGWQFLHGGSVTSADAMVVGLKEMIRHDPSLAELADLPLGWCAERQTMGSKWNRRLKAAGS